MRTEPFLYATPSTLVSVTHMSALRRALGRSGDHARERAQSGIAALNQYCAQYAAGSEKDFSVVSRAAHCAAFELLTYGEISQQLGLSPPAVHDRLIAAGEALQTRALEQESLYREGALSPGQLFFDDLLEPILLAAPARVLDMDEASVRPTETVPV